MVHWSNEGGFLNCYWELLLEIVMESGDQQKQSKVVLSRARTRPGLLLLRTVHFFPTAMSISMNLLPERNETNFNFCKQRSDYCTRPHSRLELPQKHPGVCYT